MSARIPSVRRCAVVAAVFLLAAAPVPAALVINEILIDPDGSDGGREFVELLNTGPGAEDLSDVWFEFANGTEAAVWTTRWRGAPGRLLTAGERFLLVDRNWQGTEPFDAEAYLGLQNGPDAVRLSRDGEAVDLLGYGPLTDPLMLEGTPAAVTTGLALARRPDGWDTGDNAADFVAAEPTPGALNFRPWSLAALEVVVEPPSLDRSGCGAELQVFVANDGIETVPLAEIELHCGGQTVRSRLDVLPSGGQRLVSWQITPEEAGCLPLSLHVLPPAVPDTISLELGFYQVGPAGLVLNEVLAAPDQGQDEWIEMRAAGAEVNLGEYRLADEDGAWRPLPAVRLAAGELAVVAQDSTALEAWLAQNRSNGAADCEGTGDTGRILSLPGGWPSLNNGTASGRDFADRIRLADSTGTVIDHVIWGEGDGPWLPVPADGRSLERIALQPTAGAASNWATATHPSGSTPGCANSVVVPVGATPDLDVEPRILDPGAGSSTLHVRYELSPPAFGAEVRIYDLWGGLVRDLGADRLGPGPRHLLWDGRDDAGEPVPAGGYLVLLCSRAADGRILERSKVLAAVRRVARW